MIFGLGNAPKERESKTCVFQIVPTKVLGFSKVQQKMISDDWYRPKERDAEDMNSDLNAGLQSLKHDEGEVLSIESVTSPKVAFSNDEPVAAVP